MTTVARTDEATARNELLDRLAAAAGDESVRAAFAEFPIDELQRCVAAAQDVKARRAWVEQRRKERARDRAA